MIRRRGFAVNLPQVLRYRPRTHFAAVSALAEARLQVYP